MKILMLNYEYPPLGGGAGIAMSNLLAEFSGKNELEIDLISSSTGKFEVRQIASNITGHFLDIGKKGQYHSQSIKDLLLYSFKANRYSKKIIQKNKYDFIHAFFGIPCGYIAMKLGLPYIVSLRGSDVPFHNPKYELLDNMFFKRMSRKIWNKAEFVISNSESLKQEAIKTSSSQQVELIYNGIDTKKFYPARDKKSNTIRFVFTGRLSTIKGLTYLVEAFGKLKQKYPLRSIELWIVGDGPLKGQLKKIAKQYKIYGYIKFFGKVENQKIPELLRSCDVFVLPSTSEGMPMSLLEAMACGLGIICTDIITLKKLLSGKESGFVVKKSNMVEVFSAMGKYVEGKKELITKHGNVNRKKTLQMSWDKVAEEYITYYRKITKK